MDSKTFREVALSYAAVYDQELKEELQEKQDFENWVNSLVEEGYDLSEYTWEDMYEAYIEEQGGRGSSTASQTNQSVRIPGGRTATRVMSDLGTSLAASTKVPTSSGPRNVRGGGTVKPTPAAKPAPQPAAAKPVPTPAAKPAPTPAAKPAPQPAAAKPVPTAAKPQAAKPAPTAAAKPAGSAMDQWAKANPRLAQAQKIRQQGGSRAEVNKSLYNKGTAAATSTPTVVKAGVDLFDIVRGYLLDGGYAETLEEAEWMMANIIDEEAIAIIVEASCEDDEDEKEMKKGKKSKKEKEEDDKEEKLDEAIRNPESRKKLRAIMDREVVKGDKSKGQNPRKKYHTKTGDQAFSLLMKRDETGSKDNPVRKRGGTNAPPEERVGKGPNRAGNAKYWAGTVGPTRDRGAGNKAARRAGKSVPNNRYED